jgi:hypothetical protein
MDTVVRQLIKKIAWQSFEAGANGMKPSEFLEIYERIMEEADPPYNPTLCDCIGPEESL